MGSDTKIEWADHTFNPWTGCQRISPGCDHCYAEALARRAPRTFGSWQPGGARRRTSLGYWEHPIRWNTSAARRERAWEADPTKLVGTPPPARPRVFCASMADVFDNAVPPDWRADLWTLIAETPHLDWLLLTKRPQNATRMLPGSHVEQLLGRDLPPWPWPNVWLGTSVENRDEMLRRGSILAALPAERRFWSCEPLLGALDGIPGELMPQWVIAGGESGPKARPSHPDWFRSLRDQCQAAGVPFFFKQWGEWAPEDQMPLDATAPGVSARFWTGGPNMSRAGKRANGALLDGIEWRSAPA